MLAFQKRLLLNVTAGNVIRLLPPLIVNEQEVEQIATRVVASINAFSQSITTEN
jgi:acetylornithine aminotransferase